MTGVSLAVAVTGLVWASVGFGAIWPVVGEAPIEIKPSASPSDGRVFWDWPVDLDLADERGISFDFLVSDVSQISDANIYLQDDSGWFISHFSFTKVGEWERVSVRKADFAVESGSRSRRLGRVRKLRLSIWRYGSKRAFVRAKNFAYTTEAEAARPYFAETDPLKTKAGEWRAFWCHSARGLKGKSWDESIRMLKDSGFNAVVPNLARGGSAFYQSKVLPIDPSVEKEGDALRECIAACRKYGVECHVWKMCWNPWTADPKTIGEWKRAGRTQKSDDGTDKGFEEWLCPTHPDNVKLEADAFVELARSGVDGVHLDYIRYPYRAPYCYCERCRGLFERRIGRKLANWPKDIERDPALKSEWTAFRCGNITAAVREISRRVRKECPGVKISAAVFEYTYSNPEIIAQDWPAWCREKLVDFVCPMDYYMSAPPLHESLIRSQREDAAGVPVRPGIGLSLWSKGMSARDLAEKVKAEIRGVRAAGLDGFCIFNYDGRAVAPLDLIFGR